MKIAFFGDSITEGFPGASYFRLLEQKYHEHKLFNCGKGGDTTISLYRRITMSSPPWPFDMAFLWIGVNDVLVKTSWPYPLLKRVRRQPWAKSRATFIKYYQDLLGYLSPKTGWLFTVSPLLIGEDVNNAWNKELGEVGALIEELSGRVRNCTHIDLKTVFHSNLGGKVISPHVPKSFLRILRDVARLKTANRIESESSARGLHLTLDGVHLNQAGATIVADTFSTAIDRRLKDLFPDD